jgi:5-methylcytosine-specific restriction endonuclease McrA
MRPASSRVCEQKLRTAVLQRDGWRCQNCGRMDTLQIHHIQFRSHQGRDTEENLITLCSACHRHLHLCITDS